MSDFCVREDELAARWRITVSALRARRLAGSDLVPRWTQPGGPGTRILYSLSSIEEFEQANAKGGGRE